MKVPEPRQLPSGSWFIQLRLGGESIPVTEPTRAACLNAARLIKAEYLAGREVKKKKLPPAPDMTLRELLTGYIEKYRGVWSPVTVRSYCSIRDNRFAAVADVKLRDVKSWQKVVSDEAALVKGKTVKSAWSCVRAAMRDAGMTPPEVTLPKFVSAERPWLTSEEIRRFVAAVRGSDYEIPILLGLHGLRHSAASLAHFVGVPAHETQIIFGWEDPATMRKIYEHIEAAGILRAQNAMAAFFAAEAPAGGAEKVSASDTNANTNANEPRND